MVDWGYLRWSGQWGILWHWTLGMVLSYLKMAYSCSQICGGARLQYSGCTEST